jgi:two-component system chemotaxis sensor kinase CheA
LIETSYCSSSDSSNNNEIKSLHGIEVIEYQDKIVPIVRVSDILEIPQDESLVPDKVTIVIIDKGGKPYGLVVDSFERKQEIVIKKFNNTSDSENTFHNATILPDGKVALILDPEILI